MKEPQLLIIGGGAAGMMSAIAAAKKGISVTLLEKRESTGKKLRITGKGKCNITNNREWEEFSKQLHPNSRFLKSSFLSFSNRDTVRFFEESGVKCVVERGERVFPQSGRASDVVEALRGGMERLGVEVRYNCRATSLQLENGRIVGVESSCGTLYPEVVVIATGGLSYPITGSEGDGYRLAEGVGHTVVSCWPSLTALMPKGYDTDLKGLLLKNIELSLFIERDLLQRERGEIEFTNNGVEGALGFKVSRKAVKAMINGNRVSLVINLKPALSNQQIKARVKRELESFSGESSSLFLRKFIPAQLVSPFIRANKIPAKLSELGREEEISTSFVEFLTNWRVEVESYTSYERAVVTAGGVSLKEISSKTMRSKLVENLFFAGEVIDLDGETGGYNLQIAFSTGHKAGEEAAYLILNSSRGS